jgi:hypothetical protein
MEKGRATGRRPEDLFATWFTYAKNDKCTHHNDHIKHKNQEVPAVSKGNINGFGKPLL